MDKDQARRWAEEVDLPEPDGTAEANMQPHPEGGYTYDEVPAWSETIVREAIAAALVKLTQQEPIVWGYRTKSGLFDCISNEEHARAPGDYDIPLYTHPAPSQQEDSKPLTPEQIVEGAKGWKSLLSFQAGVRFSEAAHNIREQQ